MAPVLSSSSSKREAREDADEISVVRKSTVKVGSKVFDCTLRVEPVDDDMDEDQEEVYQEWYEQNRAASAASFSPERFDDDLDADDQETVTEVVPRFSFNRELFAVNRH